jgi:hypothetical protein
LTPQKNRLVDPEILFEILVGRELQRRKIFSSIKGSFVSSVHVLSNQGRSSMPSDFDCDLGYTMGFAAGALVDNDRSGLLVSVDPDFDQLSAIPLTSVIRVFDSDSRCGIEIEKKPLGRKKNILPCPTERRFLNPGPLQWSSVDEDHVRGEPTSDGLEKMAKLCSQVMSLAATVTDEKSRNVISAGLKYALEIVGRHGSSDTINDMSVLSPRNSERSGYRRRRSDFDRP